MDIDPEFKSWFVGLSEGEACFALTHNRDTRFDIVLREDDRPALEYIYSVLGVGKVYNRSRQYKRDKGIRTKDVCLYSVWKTEDLVNVIIPIFESVTMRTKKRVDFELWRDIVLHKYSNPPHSADYKYQRTKQAEMCSDLMLYRQMVN